MEKTDEEIARDNARLPKVCDACGWAFSVGKLGVKVSLKGGLHAYHVECWKEKQ